MTPAELTAARKALGFKNAAAFGRALEMEGRDPGRMVSQWEKGAATIPGPVRVAVRLMLKEKAQEAFQALAAPYLAAVAPEPAPAPPEPAVLPLKHRRRG